MAIGPGQTLGGRNGVSIYMIIHKSAAFLLQRTLTCISPICRARVRLLSARSALQIARTQLSSL